MTIPLPLLLGSIGVALVATSYLLVQMQRMQATTLLYPCLNLVGSLFIVYHLLEEWNSSAILIEAIWACISLFGVIRHFRRTPLQA